MEAANWIHRRELLQEILPRSYWTIVELFEDGRWRAHTPGLHFSGMLHPLPACPPLVCTMGMSSLSACLRRACESMPSNKVK